MRRLHTVLLLAFAGLLVAAAHSAQDAQQTWNSSCMTVAMKQ